ncbi:Bardet-Biedl syndrome 12 protein [Bufo gargarizans]|uniref:Bardet-Biedl syndrome 12 protein n=1 Tax=Bufo gargarizans TaxID=30331 RepID=UPI001CF19617|nr:Bardet-Biedl syndrome 12 protein [Bufo gargarizans]
MSAMKLGGHLGLIELVNISSSVKTFLGPRKSYKFIYDQDTQESTLTCSSFRLLESLDLSSAVGQLFNETIQAHNKAYKTGTTTLFFLVGVWSKAVLECLHQGVPVSLIVSVMIEGLNSCIDSVEALHIPLFNILRTKQNSSQSSSVVDGRTGYVSNNQNHCFSSRGENFGLERQGHIVKTIKHAEITVPSKGNLYSQKCQMRKLSSSRHFSKIRHFLNPSQTSRHSLEDLTKSLSHGNGEIMELVEKAAALLFENAHEISVTKDLFQASCLNICFLRGLSDVNSNATSGYVTFLTPEYATIVQNLEGKPLKVLLLDGELTENYRHLGFNKATGLKSVSEFANNERRTSEEVWISTAYQRIVQANIDLILVKGDACPQLVSQCMHRNILIITHIKPNILQAFSDCTGAEQVAYLTQISHHNIGCDVYAKICPQWSSESSQTIAVSLLAHRMNLVTVMLRCRLMPKMQVMEDQFWACSYKLHNALLDQKVFPGGGAVELFCLYHLRKLEERLISVSSVNREPQFFTSSWLYTSAIHYRSSVYRCLAQGWIKYLSTLLFNIGEYSSEFEAMTFIQNETQKLGACSSPSLYLFNEYSRNVVFVDDLEHPQFAHRKVMVYDNVIPKVEAWRSAVHLVLTVLQSDAEIITGSTTQKQIITGESGRGDYVFL